MRTSIPVTPTSECYRILCSAFKGDIPYKIGEATETETEENAAAATVYTHDNSGNTGDHSDQRRKSPGSSTYHGNSTTRARHGNSTNHALHGNSTPGDSSSSSAQPRNPYHWYGKQRNWRVIPPTGTTTDNRSNQRASACPGVTFGATPNISDINARMMEIANNGPPATATTDRPDRQRQWSFNRGFVETRSCHGCGEQGHLIKNCPNRPYCSHCKTKYAQHRAMQVQSNINMEPGSTTRKYSSRITRSRRIPSSTVTSRCLHRCWIPSHATNSKYFSSKHKHPRCSVCRHS